MPQPILPGVVTTLQTTWAGGPAIRRAPVQPTNVPDRSFKYSNISSAFLLKRPDARSIEILTYTVDTADISPDITSPANLPDLRSLWPENWRHPRKHGLTSVGIPLRSSVISSVNSSVISSVNSSVLSLNTRQVLASPLIYYTKVRRGPNEFSLRVLTPWGQRAAGETCQT